MHQLYISLSVFVVYAPISGDFFEFHFPSYGSTLRSPSMRNKSSRKPCEGEFPAPPPPRPLSSQTILLCSLLFSVVLGLFWDGSQLKVYGLGIGTVNSLVCDKKCALFDNLLGIGNQQQHFILKWRQSKSQIAHLKSPIGQYKSTFSTQTPRQAGPHLGFSCQMPGLP